MGKCRLWPLLELCVECAALFGVAAVTDHGLLGRKEKMGSFR
jgi:hypothetical protein